MGNLFDKAGGQQPQEADQQNPAYMKALEMAKAKLYEEGAAEGLAQTLASAPEPAQAMADMARMMLQGVDDMTEGEVPDEMFMSLGLELLGEVAEIAQAAGQPIDGKTIAAAAREFILGVTEDLGGDTAPLKEAMGSIDPAEVGAALDTAEV